MGDVFKALADPTRRTILDELAERDGQTISQHLAVLEEAGLVATRKEGRYKFHDLQRGPLEHLAERWLAPQEDP